jgi:type IV secretory pathway TrbL component
MAIRWKSAPMLAVFVVCACAGSRALAGDVASEMKKAGKSIAKAATKFGHEVADMTDAKVVDEPTPVVAQNKSDRIPFDEEAAKPKRRFLSFGRGR